MWAVGVSVRVCYLLREKVIRIYWVYQIWMIMEFIIIVLLHHNSIESVVLYMIQVTLESEFIMIVQVYTAILE